MKRKTILFFSTEAGLAHITRSLAIAQELQKRGHRIFFATGSKHELVKKVNIKPVQTLVSLNEGLTPEVILKWKDAQFIKKVAISDKKIIEKYKPDCIVIDFRSPAVAASLTTNLPIFFITGSGGLPGGCHLPTIGIPKFIHKLIEPTMQKLIWNAKKPFYETIVSVANQLGAKVELNDLKTSLQYIVPEISTYLPNQDKNLTINYVGPIFWNHFNTYKPDWLKNMKPDRKTVYITFGGTGYDGSKLISLAENLVDAGFRVIVSSSTIADPKQFPVKKNLYVADYVDGTLTCTIADVIVCHGGYGTMMQALRAGKPVVAIPYNPDQLIHAFRVQELGLGQTVTNFNILKFLPLKWERIMNLGNSVEVDQITKRVRAIFDNYQSYKTKIHIFKSQLPSVNGSVIAADVIENSNLL